jgi:ferredoxin-NADP reductase
MRRLSPGRSQWFRAIRLGVIVAWTGLLLAAPARGQVSPEEHKKHHPAAGQPGNLGGPMGAASVVGGMAGMGPMGALGAMCGMGAPAAKELYPSLMSLPELTPEKRAEVQRQAHERMQAGTALMSQGLDRLAKAAPANDYAAMQEATAQVREGLSLFDSGLAAHRALAEGKAPRDLALQWFKREMNLSAPPTGPEAPAGPFGLSWFHFFVMVVLVGFAVVMVWMYFHKMRRASELLARLTSGAPVVGATAGGAAVAPGATVVPPPAVAPPPDGSPAPLAVAGTGAGPATVVPTIPAPPRAGPWSGLLRVARIFEETPDVKTFRFTPPEGGPLPFSYLPGQFLSLTVRQDDKPVRRSYTIASSPTQRDYVEITVKRVEQGVVSGYLHDQLKEGDRLEVSAPFGSFTFTGREADSIVLIGGGVGITPLMTAVRYLTDHGWPQDIFLLYSCRTSRDFIFREELEYLQRRYANLHVVASMTRAAGTEWMGPTGRLTKELIAQNVPNIVARRVHLCGPPPMMEVVQGMLAELGVPKAQVKTESFTLARGKPEPERQALETKPAVTATVTFAKSRKSAPLPPDRTVLEVAEGIGVEIPNICRVGVCGACKTKLLSGSVTMAVQDALTPEDKAKGLVLACQAKSTVPISVEA